MEVRSAINTTTNVTSGFDATYGVEIMKAVDRKIQEILNNQTPLRNLIPRKSTNGQMTYNWNIRSSNNDSATFYSDGGCGTASTGGKIQLIARADSLRSDWEVTGLFKASTASYYDAVGDEASNAAVALANLEEGQIITGTDAGGYGSADGFLGFKQLIDSFVTRGDTTTVYGITRANTKTYMDCQLVNGGSGALTLTMLDSAYTAIVKKAGKAGYIVCSPDKADEISQLLQSQQRFQGSVKVAGGFEIMTYRGVPVVPSVYMDKAGDSDTDTKVYFMGAGIWEMRVLEEFNNVMVANTRCDITGGYIKGYEVLVCKDLTKNSMIYALMA